MAQTQEMKALLNILCTVLGFVVVAMAATAFTPPRYVTTVTEKLGRYTEAGNDYDILAIGSSRTYRQIIPQIFDATAKAAGKQARLFNLGVDGMRPPEDTYLLEKALALRKKPLKLVLVECNSLRFEVRPEDENTVRAIHWHDGKRLATMARLAFTADDKKRGFRDRVKRFGETFPKFWEHVGYWFQNVTAFGRANEILTASLFDTKQIRNAIGPDGFKDSPKRDGLSPDELRRFEKDVSEMRKTPPRFEKGDRVSQAELAEKRRLVEKAGAKMVLIVPPYPMNKRFLPADESEHAAVLDFSNPNEFPELYTPANRLDEGHTNRSGSEIYTRMIVERLLPQL
jgi:hypothetical protein